MNDPIGIDVLSTMRPGKRPRGECVLGGQMSGGSPVRGGANFLLSGPVSTVPFVEPTACRAAELAAANMFPCLNDDGLNGGAGADELH